MSTSVQDVVQLPSGHSAELSLRTQPEVVLQHSPSQLAVLLHPWSWLGGNMDDRVICFLGHALYEGHYHVLRYNSRGVGRSKGWPSLTGSQEAQDLREIVQWALGQVPDVQHLLLVGYSHGSLITSQHLPLLASNTIKTSHILLSYPLGPRAFLTCFRSSAYTAALSALARDPTSRVLIIYGDRDEFTSINSYEQWSTQLHEEGKVGANQERLTVSCIKDGTHFWAQPHAEEMVRVIQRWLTLDERGRTQVVQNT